MPQSRKATPKAVIRPQEHSLQKIQKSINGRRSGVLGPCIEAYEAHIGDEGEPVRYLNNLTYPLLAARDATKSLIRAEMTNRWRDKPDRTETAIINSLKRSAGTNFQTMTAYALAKYLEETGSAWYIQHPVPKELKSALAIVFSGNVEIEGESTEDLVQEALEENADNKDAEAASVFVVQPDVDILIRNSEWSAANSGREPIILLSVKTSLADRAGMAARWKTYFDQATNPCPLSGTVGCSYDKLGIKMPNADKYHIYHVIVTANIYKLEGRDEKARRGELNSGQTRSNTYMFDLKLTTRDDPSADTPSDWHQFPYIIQFLETVSTRFGLPSRASTTLF
ncbi:hypothetical protein [Deinococcus sp. Leaf326]|uniref:hypothetical protein n=1 Tax=Deinococcus sp. Leaf326 TaxID=1736338 RepID=UPI0012E1A972|nr:hypothetical protein [Deinococcus sp. Leaf326]